MTPNDPDALFEQVFALADAAAVPADGRVDLTVPMAHLEAALDRTQRQPAEIADTPDHSTARLAAYLDGGLDADATQAVRTGTSQSPEVFHDIVGALAFTEAVAASRISAPADLVEAAAALAAPWPVSLANSPPRRWRRWLVGTVAIAASAAMAIVVREPSVAPVRPELPVARNAPAHPLEFPPSSDQGQPRVGHSPSHPPATVIAGAGPRPVEDQRPSAAQTGIISPRQADAVNPSHDCPPMVEHTPSPGERPSSHRPGPCPGPGAITSLPVAAEETVPVPKPIGRGPTPSNGLDAVDVVPTPRPR